MDNEIYHGVEAEGRLKGVPTVFAKRPCLQAVEHAKSLSISHVFFGIRGHRLIAEDYETLDKLLFSAIPPTWIISLHVELDRACAIPAWAYERCHVLLYAPLSIAGLLSGDVEIKLENHAIAAVYTRPQMIDLTYVRDRELSCS